MANARNINMLLKFLKDSQSAVVRGHTIALLETTQKAESMAQQNIRKNFTGRMGRKRTGRLSNGVFTQFSKPGAGDKFASASIGVRGVPYAATMEFGDKNRKPVKAQHLWVKTDYKGKFKSLTPTEFMELRKKAKQEAKARPRRKPGEPFKSSKTYSIFTSKKGNLIAAEVLRLKTKVKIRPLFALKDSVDIPARPYLQPAVDKSLKGFRALAAKRTIEQSKG